METTTNAPALDWSEVSRMLGERDIEIFLLRKQLAALATVLPAPPQGAPMNDELISSSPTPYSARATLTTTAAPIGVSTLNLTEFMVQADPANTAAVEIGTATSQDWKLEARDTMVLPIKNLALVYAKSVSGTQRLNIFGRGGS